MFPISYILFSVSSLSENKWHAIDNDGHLMNFAGYLIPAVLLVATGYVDCNAPVAVFLITTAVGISGISFAGWSCNHLDLAPPFAGEND